MPRAHRIDHGSQCPTVIARASRPLRFATSTEADPHAKPPDGEVVELPNPERSRYLQLGPSSDERRRCAARWRVTYPGSAERSALGRRRRTERSPGARAGENARLRADITPTSTERRPLGNGPIRPVRMLCRHAGQVRGACPAPAKYRTFRVDDRCNQCSQDHPWYGHNANLSETVRPRATTPGAGRAPRRWEQGAPRSLRAGRPRSRVPSSVNARRVSVVTLPVEPIAGATLAAAASSGASLMATMS
jgi:hypothetical protein